MAHQNRETVVNETAVRRLLRSAARRRRRTQPSTPFAIDTDPNREFGRRKEPTSVGALRRLRLIEVPRRAIATWCRLRLSLPLPELLWGTSVNGEAGCMLCSQPRVLKALFPVAKGYELKLYECANCTSILWLITRVTRSSALKRQTGRLPPGARFKTIDAALEAAAGMAGTPKGKGPQG